mmetsp:Transcript_51995/g.130655  ORF Transcript_51995/g.130655 Transcript_51995/m.130655 type:complete len:219 (-) Transcript_51995:23-679(-)
MSRCRRLPASARVSAGLVLTLKSRSFLSLPFAVSQCPITTDETHQCQHIHALPYHPAATQPPKAPPRQPTAPQTHAHGHTQSHGHALFSVATPRPWTYTGQAVLCVVIVFMLRQLRSLRQVANLHSVAALRCTGCLWPFQSPVQRKMTPTGNNGSILDLQTQDGKDPRHQCQPAARRINQIRMTTRAVPPFIQTSLTTLQSRHGTPTLISSLPSAARA